MAEIIVNRPNDVVGTNTWTIEQSMTISTGASRAALPICDFAKVRTLRSLFASVEITKVAAEVRQNCMIGDEEGDLSARGHIYISLIPSSSNSDALSGSAPSVILAVPNKMVFPLDTASQSVRTYDFPLLGYELDVAQDPRRGAAPVVWVGNTGVSAKGKSQLTICTVTWRVTISCSGDTAVWLGQAH